MQNDYSHLEHLPVEERIERIIVAERSKVDLFYLVKYILGGGDLIDPKVHGPVCKSFRHLVFKDQPEKSLEYEFPSDFGRTEEEGVGTEEDHIAFAEWEKQFEPNVNAAHAVRDKLDINLTSLLAMLPRGTLKTSIITIGGTIQWLLNWGEDRVALDSETMTKSKGFLTEIKGHFEDNEKLREVYFTIYGVYPDDKSKKQQWSTEMIVMPSRTKARKEPSIDCFGIGTTRNGFHYDIAFLDDLHSELNTKTKDEIDKVKEHRKLVYSLLDPNAPQVVICTRWAYTDAYQEIIDEEYEDFNFITRSAQSTDGSLFYPSRLDRRALDKFRRLLGPYLFSCQYMNNPTDTDDAVFLRENFKYLTRDQMSKKKINWYGLVDPSYDGPSSDYCAIVIAGIDAAGNYYVKHVVRAKMTYKAIIEEMFRLQAIFNPIRWCMEIIGTKTLEHTLVDQQRKKGRSLRVHLIRSRNKAKTDRIMALSPFYEGGQVYHCISAPGIADLEDELADFPRAKHDDVSDCLANIFEVAIRPQAGGDNDEKTTSGIDRSYITMLNKPRSPMVGY